MGLDDEINCPLIPDYRTKIPVVNTPSLEKVVEIGLQQNSNRMEENEDMNYPLMSHCLTGTPVPSMPSLEEVVELGVKEANTPVMPDCLMDNPVVNIPPVEEVVEIAVEQNLQSEYQNEGIDYPLMCLPSLEEVVEIAEEQESHSMGHVEEMIYPLMPDCFLRCLEKLPLDLTSPLTPDCLLRCLRKSQQGTAEKSMFGRDFNTEMILSLTSRIVYGEQFQKPVILLSELLRDSCELDSTSCTKQTRPNNLPFTLEMPVISEEKPFRSAYVDPSIIAADTSPRPVKDLSKLLSSDCLESFLVSPEFRLDDNQFRSLPVPVLYQEHDEVFNVAIARSTASHCKTCSVPATDWLYLDWHFFHGAQCNDATCFSLQERMTEDQCRPVNPAVLTSEFLLSRKCSERFLKILQLLDDDELEVPSINRLAIATQGEEIESLFNFPPAVLWETQGKQSNEIGDKAWKHHEKVFSIHPLSCQSTPADVNFHAEVNKIDSKGSFPLARGPHLSRNESSNAGDRGLKIQKQNRATDRESRGEALLLRLQQTEKLATVRPDFLSSDLDFFVQARKGILADPRDVEHNENSSNSNARSSSLPINASDEQSGPAFDHEIELSEEILKCLLSLASNYYLVLALEDTNGSKIIGDLKVPLEFGFDIDDNRSLTTLISNVSSQYVTTERQKIQRSLTGLHVLRYTALNLCNYGIQVAHLYLENCFEKMSFLEGSIISSRIELEEAYNQVERGALEDHPKLGCIDKLLGPISLEIQHAGCSSEKVLLIADRRVFFTLVRKLVSLNLTPYQIDRKEQYLQNGVLIEDQVDKLNQEVSDALEFSDCLLVSHMYMNPSFQIQRFTTVIQYGDPPSASSMGCWSKVRCARHTLKVKVDLEEVRMKSASWSQAGDLQHSKAYIPSEVVNVLEPEVVCAETTLQTVAKVRMEDPVVQQSNKSSSVSPNHQLVEENSSLEGRCDMIIVANISHPIENNLTGRRSSYQRVLRLEKENLQIVERELRLPVDLILKAASCLVLYTLRKLKIEPQEIQQKQVLFRNEVETHMKAISFSFQDCIMIFEGPTEFTSAALDVLPHICALAIALEMQLQCFVSRHMEVTDRIITKCIEAVRRSKQMPSYPIMTEGPTLAEVFLTEFPSLNPLTAHAILSSGWPIPAFMTLEHEKQLSAIEGFEVPQHSLELFKAQCIHKSIGSVVIPDPKGLQVNASGGDQYDQQDVRVSPPHRKPATEVWNGPPEFLSEAPSLNMFPDFPPAAQVNGCQDVDCRQESRHMLAGRYSVLAIGGEPAGAEVIQWAINSSENKYTCGASQNSFGAHDMGNNLSGVGISRHLRVAQDLHGGQNILKLRQPSSFGSGHNHALNEEEIHNLSSFVKERVRRPWDKIAALDESSHLGAADEKFYGHHKMPLKSPDICGVENVTWLPNSLREGDDSTYMGAKYGSPGLLLTSPSYYEGVGFNDVIDNGHEQTWGVPQGFTNEVLDLPEIDSHFEPGSPACFSELSDPREQWSTVAQDNQFSKPRHPRRQTLLSPSLLDKFRYQPRRLTSATASNKTEIGFSTAARIQSPNMSSRTRIQAPNVGSGTKIKAPNVGSGVMRRKQSPSLSNRTRKQPPNADNLRQTNPGRPPVATIKSRGDSSVDKRPKKVLGCARSGNDNQQRLVWRNRVPVFTSKRQKMDPMYTT